MNCPKVSIIILNWNGKEDTIECLESLKHITYPNYEILLVDNGSSDESAEYFKEAYPGIRLIQNDRNLGFAEGNNVALRQTLNDKTEYVLLLNNDTTVDPNFLSELIKVAESDYSIGIVGPTIYHYREAERIQSAGGKIYWKRGMAPHYTDKDGASVNEVRDVDYIMGCALLGKSKLIKEIGYLNNKYFAYWEETDWCIKAQKAGYRTVHVPRSKIWHKGGASTKKTNGFREYHMTRNMFWFMRQHATSNQYISFIVYFFGAYFWYYSAILVFYKRNIQAYYFFLKGIVEGMKKSYL